ncbi:glycosyltransferase [Microbacterium sp. ZW T5_56]|uniref:glycosyltransferase n=1 Tax=Microbacterium sp. ZW T5_56 TaxID=3378081 RepID=UPI00385228B5
MPETSTSDTGGNAPDSRIDRLEQELDVVRAQRDAARRQVRALESSTAYRIGGKAAWLPRKLRGLRRRLTSRGEGAPVSGSQRGPQVAGESVSGQPTPFRAVPGTVSTVRVAEPDVSVVVPVHNSEAWLDDCLSSVLAQTGVTLEVICINDGSTDDSRAVLQRFADQDPRVSIIDQPNQGQSVGRNAGLDAAAGRYLIYLDSDDFWPDDTLAGLVRRADEQNLDVLMFDCYAFLDGTVAAATWKRYSTYYQRAHAYGEVRPGPQMIADMRRNRDYRPHVGMYIARTAFVRDSASRFIPGIIHQDNPYTFALLLNAERVAHTDADIYARRIRPGSTITTLHDARSVGGYFLSYVAMVREIQGREFTPEVTDMIAEVVYGVFDGASKKVASLTPSELAEVKALDGRPDAQLAFFALKKFRSR